MTRSRVESVVVFGVLVGLVPGCGSCGSCGSGNGSGERQGGLAASELVQATTHPDVVCAPAKVSACQVDGADAAVPMGAPMSFAALAKRADPGVVMVQSSVERVLPDGRRSSVGEWLGTGFVYDEAGLVLTNNHVVEGATVIVVQFTGGRSVKASVRGADRLTDVAVLELDGVAGLHALPLGDSDVVEVGDWVFAIGNPFGLSHTVSAGILSAKGRTRDDVRGLNDNGYFNFLQTDAAINEGNSGGPLMNLRGEVVGMNTAVRGRADRIGFAIPINMVKIILPILVKNGKIKRSALGAVVRELDVGGAERLKRPDMKGAWVVDVGSGSGADRAGLRPDDVIIGFDGKIVEDPNMLRWWASIAGVGSTVVVKIARGSRTFDLNVELGELPEPPEQPKTGFPSSPILPPDSP